jgi:hypothetical protein
MAGAGATGRREVRAQDAAELFRHPSSSDGLLKDYTPKRFGQKGFGRSAKRNVVRMHPVEYDFDRGPGRGVVLEHSVALLGPADFSARDVPAKTAGVAKPLRPVR